MNTSWTGFCFWVEPSDKQPPSLPEPLNTISKEFSPIRFIKISAIFFGSSTCFLLFYSFIIFFFFFFFFNCTDKIERNFIKNKFAL
jgi:hypothetical protein